MNPTKLGVCYYPEHWDRSLWREDALRMADLGLSCVRIGEFAWSRFEPSPGAFTWDWCDEAIEALSEAGLKVILGTPTATPPKWLIDAHPEILACDAEGRPRRFGSRRHYCFSSEVYREQSKRIVTAMARRYGGHDAVVAWQTDNEYGCHDTVRSYSPAAQAAFHTWLEDRYGEIAALNEAWGAVFWSQDYRSFDEIDLPNLTVTEPNPSHVLDFCRFSSDQVVSFNRLQTEILRTESPGRDIYHNFMGFYFEFDHFDVGEDIDVAGWDSYPLGFLDIGDFPDSEKALFMRQGHPDFAGFHHDLYRGCGRGRWGVLEQQPGPVNWARNNPAPLPGMVRLWTLEAAAHGAELVSYFRWRQAPFAQEQMHAGLLRPDDQPATGFGEVRQAADDLSRLEAAPAETEHAKAAMIFSYETLWMSEIQPQGSGWYYPALFYHWYSAFRRLGVDVDIVRPGADLSQYSLVAAPSLFHVDDAAMAALTTTDAQLLFGPRSGSKTASFQIPPTLAPGPLQRFLPVTIARSESLSAQHVEAGVFDGLGVSCGVWLDHAETELSPLAATHDHTGLVYRNDRAWLLTTVPDDDFLIRILTKALDAAGVGHMRLPDELRLRRRGALTFAFNYGAHDATLPDATGIGRADILIGAPAMPPSSVTVWK